MTIRQLVTFALLSRDANGDYVARFSTKTSYFVNVSRDTRYTVHATVSKVQYRVKQRNWEKKFVTLLIWLLFKYYCCCY